MSTLNKALEYVGTKSLPKAGSSEFTGRAIAQVRKFSGSVEYVVVMRDEKDGKIKVVKDFNPQGGYVTDYAEFYPLKIKEEKPFVFEELNPADMKKWLDDNNVPYLKKNKESYLDAYIAFKGL